MHPESTRSSLVAIGESDKALYQHLSHMHVAMRYLLNASIDDRGEEGPR